MAASLLRSVKQARVERGGQSSISCCHKAIRSSVARERALNGGTDRRRAFFDHLEILLEFFGNLLGRVLHKRQVDQNLSVACAKFCRTSTQMSV